LVTLNRATIKRRRRGIHRATVGLIGATVNHMIVCHFAG